MKISAAKVFMVVSVFAFCAAGALVAGAFAADGPAASFSMPTGGRVQSGWMDFDSPIDGFMAMARNAYYERIDPAEHAAGYDVRGDQRPGLPNALPEFGGHYLDLSATMWTNDGDERARANGRRVVDSVSRNMSPDGYIGGETPGREMLNFSIWNQAHTVYGLSRFAVCCNDGKARELAARGARWLAAAIASMPKGEIVNPATSTNGGSQNLCALLALENVSRMDQSIAFGDLERGILSQCESTPMNLLSFGDVMSLQSQKGIEMIVNYRGVLAYGRRYGDKAAVDASRRYWKGIATGQMRNTGNGTIGELWRRDGNLPAILTVDMLPNENCVASGWVRFSREIAEVDKSGMPGDEMERTLLNHLLGSISDDGTDFAYYQPNVGKKVFRRNASYNCCRYRGLAVAAHLREMFFVSNGGEVRALLYGNTSYSEPDGFTIVERTDYPRSGLVTFDVVGGSTERTFSLRVPRWCESVVGDTGARKIGPGGRLSFSVEFRMKFNCRHVEISGRKYSEYTYGPLVLVRDTHYGDKLGSAIPDDVEFRRIVSGDGEIALFEGFDSAGGRHMLVDFASACRHDPGTDEFEAYIPRQ